MSTLAEIEAAIPALQRYARSLVGNRQDADDLVQDCLVRALSRLPGETPTRGDEPGAADLPVRPWLFAILHNLSASRWRTLQRRGVPVELGKVELAVPPAQEWAPLRRDLLRSFEQLSSEHRQVLLLVSVEGLPYRTAAEIMGVPLGTVMSRLSRARDALRASMNGVEGAALRRVK